MELLDAIGTGAHGTVYRARVNSELVAVKKICDRMASLSEGIGPCPLREAVLVKCCDHVNIVPLLDQSISDNVVSLVFPLYDCNLWHVIKNCGIDNDKKMDIAARLIEAVKYLHGHGIVHRDIKPENVFVIFGKDWKVVLGDFGLARQTYIERGPWKQTMPVFTACYRPPELLLDTKRKYDCTVDVWSLGVVLLELMWEKRAFRGHCEYGHLIKIFRLLGTPDSDDTDHFPKWKPTPLPEHPLTPIVSRMLVVNPDDRPDIFQVSDTPMTNTKFAKWPHPQVMHIHFETMMSRQMTWTVHWPPKLNDRHYGILVDWLIAVIIHHEFDLSEATLHRCVQLCVRVLSSGEFDIHLKNFQLIGSACLFVASKLEEIYPMMASDLVYLADHTFTDNCLGKIERKIARVLDWDLVRPMTWEFLKLLVEDFEAPARKCAEMLLVYSHTRVKFSSYKPSILASTIAVYTTMIMDIPAPLDWKKDESCLHDIQDLGRQLKGDKLENVSLLYPEAAKLLDAFNRRVP